MHTQGLKKEEIDLSFFDIMAYLDDRSISWATSGKNISVGWLGLNCPFCNDHSNHGAVNFSSMAYTCWKCGPKGSVLKLVQKIDNCSFGRALDTTKKFVLTDFKHLVKPVRNHADKALFPYGTTDELLKIHRDFLIKRKYDPDVVQRKYDLQGVGPTADSWKFRLIIPVYMNNQLMTYVGRDVTGNLAVPYMNAPVEKSVLQAKHCLYNLDSVRDTAIIVEGIFDAWRIGEGAVGTFGTMFTSEQIQLLAEKKIKRAFVLFDGRADDGGEAIKHAHKMANDMTSVVREVEVLELDSGDPDSLTEDEVFEIRRDIGLK